MDPKEAMKRDLHVGYGRSPLGGPSWRKPRGVLGTGEVIVRNSDCEPERSEELWTREKWDRAVEKGGLWRKVGMWSFTLWDDPAADAIAFANRNPDAAGRKIHRLENRRCETCRHWNGEESLTGPPGKPRGYCKKFEEFADFASEEHPDKFYDAPFVAWPECGHDGPAVEFETAPDFGCNLWEEK